MTHGSTSLTLIRLSVYLVEAIYLCHKYKKSKDSKRPSEGGSPHLLAFPHLLSSGIGVKFWIEIDYGGIPFISLDSKGSH